MAKSISDKIDYGSVGLPVEPDDLKALEPILSQNIFEIPTMKISVYKNRRGKYKSIYLWCKADLGTCRVDPLFVTTWQYELLEVGNLSIKISEGAW